MTKDEISAMKPGRELNIKVAEDVMGYKVIADETFGDMVNHGDSISGSIWGPLPPYSEDISSAWQVLQRIKQLNLEVIPFDNGQREFEDVSHMTPEAICKGALLAVLKAKNE